MKWSNTYQRDLLKKLLQGELSVEERHSLEKMALDDPFLFEALEGFEKQKQE